jgi:PAS domain S-box-containing protein
MGKSLNTLILEDSQIDLLRLLRELERGGFDVHYTCVYQAADLRIALHEREWDIILSDYFMPTLNALEAMKIVKEEGFSLPVILISGAVGEELAVTAMKAGANDFFSKDKLSLLVPAVERELREAAERRKRQEAEARFTTAFHASPAGIVISRVSDGAALDVNERFLEIFGYERDQVIGARGSDLGIWVNEEQRQELLQRIYQTGSLRNAEVEVRKRGGKRGYALVSVEVVYLNDERCILTMVHDISERKAAEESLKRYTQRLELLHEIDQAILRADHPQTIAHSVLTRLQSLIKYHSASVTTYDPDYRYFTVLTVVPPVLSFLVPNKAQPVENQAMLKRLQQNEIYLVRDTETTPQLSTTEKALRDAGIRSFARIPLIVKGKLLGAFNFHAEQPDAFSIQELDIAKEAAAQLAIALYNAQLYQQIQNHAQELEQRVQERTMELQASEENLRAALAKEKELSELKTRFVSMVSHDFRTPLTLIQSSANLLQSAFNHLDEAKKARYFERIYSQIQRMVDLLDDVLTFSRAEAGAIAINREDINLDKFCREIVDEFHSASTTKHTLIYTCAEPSPHIIADAKLLHQAVINLLTNAFKYSPEGSAVYLDLSFREDHAQIQVSDSGIGIPETDQLHLFEMFYRGGNVGTIAGTGLGLAIVKRSVEAHGGTIEYESSEGKGTKFIVRLPNRGHA